MSLQLGSAIGPYTIGAMLGEGGMGRVYQARDSRLGRDVAIKVLPEAFTSDPDRLARFQREAQTLASLNHPNIASIYGFEEAPGIGALVLELVEGPTLAERIATGPIPLDDALPIARQIADALEAAHDRGIVHRDLKPANIKLRPDGTVKILDFGLAKFQPGGAASSAALAQSPTMLTSSMPGAIIGTAGYMSPDQAKGKNADQTADIWAFGCVLYEMLTGRRLFEGDTVSEVLAGVLKSDPDFAALSGDTPASIRRLLRRCLNKDRKRRLRNIGDARLEIDEAHEPPAEVTAAPQTAMRRRERSLWIGICAAALVTAIAAIAWSLRPAAPSLETRLEITTPPSTSPVSIAISPDGRNIAYVATSDSRQRLFLRPLSNVQPRVIAGTDGATLPFWSPDSRTIAFFADGRLKRVDIDGGSPRVVAQALGGYGGSWGADDTIVFAGTASPGPLFRVPADGGERTIIASTRPRPLQFSQGSPQFLPDGRFLFFVAGAPEIGGVYGAALEGTESHRIVECDGPGFYLNTGHLAYLRQGTLFAQKFDVATQTISGNPMVVSDQVAASGFMAALSASASATNTIAYRTGAGNNLRQVVWVDRGGKEVERVGAADDGDPWNPSLSPDGRTIVLNRSVNSNVDAWMRDARGVLTRFTFDAAVDNFPMWSNDGKQIVFSTNREGGPHQLYVKPSSGAGTEELLFSSDEVKAASDWSADGKYVLFRSSSPKTGYDVWALPLDTRKAFPVVQSAYAERDAVFSPDGKWIAYQSDESGRFEIYAQPFPGPGGKRQISTDGGAQVRWSRDGKEIFYIAMDSRMMAAPVTVNNATQSIDVGAPVALFATNVGGPLPQFNRQQYAVSPDGRRFLMNAVVSETVASSITIISNWKPKP